MFHRLHRLSVAANLVQMLAAGAVLAQFAAGWGAIALAGISQAVNRPLNPGAGLS